NYYRRQGVGPLQVEFAWRVGDSDVLTETLFQRLDRDHDGKLSRAEVEVDALRQLDRNNDDLVTLNEVLAEFFQPRMIFRPLPIAQAVPPAFAFRLVHPPDGARDVAAQLLARYDRDHDGRLSPAEIGLDHDVFRKLDADGDGRLNAAELAQW